MQKSFREKTGWNFCFSIYFWVKINFPASENLFSPAKKYFHCSLIILVDHFLSDSKLYFVSLSLYLKKIYFYRLPYTVFSASP